MKQVKLNQTTQGIEFKSPFDQSLIADLKIRIKARKPVYVDGKFQHWLIDHAEKNKLISLCKANGYEPIVTGKSIKTSSPTIEILKVMYIGQCKDRGNGERSAFAQFNGDWSVVIPEDVLKAWFDDGFQLSMPCSGVSSLHSALNLRWNDVMEMAPIQADKAIKQAYRKQMKRYHPDVNKDPDAQEMTMKVQDAYTKLKTPNARLKYQVGMRQQIQYEMQVKNQPVKQFNHDNYRPPVRCGMIVAMGIWRIGRFYVNEIKEWKPITNRQGQELVTSWKSGQDTFSKSWI